MEISKSHSNIIILQSAWGHVAFEEKITHAQLPNTRQDYKKQRFVGEIKCIVQKRTLQQSWNKTSPWKKRECFILYLKII